MKTNLIKFVVGAVGVAALFTVTFARGQNVEVEQQQPPAMAHRAAAADPLTLCGGCGVEIGRPRPVFVAPVVSRRGRAVVVAPRPAPVVPDYYDQHGRAVVVYYVGGVPPRPAMPFMNYALPSAYRAPAGYPHTLPLVSHCRPKY